MPALRSCSKLCLLLLAMLGCPLHMLADSWSIPLPHDYYNADSSYFLRVVPLYIPPKYHQWQQAKPKRKARFIPQDTLVVPCHAMLYQRTANGPHVVWKQDLINRVAPTAVLVSNDGRYVVTFDNWSSMGYGVDVMVVYDHQGYLLKRYNLEQISPFPINLYTKTISSLWCRCETAFTTPNQLSICFLTQDRRTQIRLYSLAELAFE